MIEAAQFHTLERDLALPGLAGELTSALAAAADPKRAAPLAADLLDASGHLLTAAWPAKGPLLARILATICGGAPFLAPFFARHPDWLLRLAEDDLAWPRSARNYAERLAAARGAIDAAETPAALRRFKYYELARITVRDLWSRPDAITDTQAVLGEISHLADALLDAALAHVSDRLARAVGPPLWSTTTGKPYVPRFAVLGLGKLGGEELNYSSDVDLIYVLKSPPEDVADGPGGLAPIEYFTRLALDFGRLVAETTADGFLYRVDLDLRPEGQAGLLVVTDLMLADYYEIRAATWEKATFMKARPVAGSLRFGWRAIRTIDPMIFRSAMDFGTVAAIRAMKEGIERAGSRGGAEHDIKIGAAGIRDIEFVAQALQLLHGGRAPQVRGRSTQRAITALAQAGILPEPSAEHLSTAYAFLRRTENRLQMEAEVQTHRLPVTPASRRRLGRAMGLLGSDPAAEFFAALEEHRRNIRTAFTELFGGNGLPPVLDLFQRNAPRLLAESATRGQIEAVAARFARAIAASPDPERAINNLDRFIRGIGARSYYYGLLVDRPELVDRLAGLFAGSQYLSIFLARHPRLIEPIFADPTVLVPSRPELRAAFSQIRADLAAEGRHEEVEADLDALRRFHNRELVNVGLLDMAGKVTDDEAHQGLTELAEVCVDIALTVARHDLDRRHGPPPASSEFLVVGMGKLATRELTYGSDLDVIFLYDIEGAEGADFGRAQEYHVRLAQKLIWVLQTHTTDGTCYQIDARLRPSGRQGSLVASLDGFRGYHAGGVQVWERQALLRARPIAGDECLAAAFTAERRAILAQPLPADAGQEIHRIRRRMEAEIAQETGNRRDFKTGRGGILDIETVVQVLQLHHGRQFPKLLEPDSTAAHIERLAALKLLDAGDTDTLRRGWRFLDRLSRRLRIVDNRSISDLDEERGDLDGLARRLGYRSAQRAGGERRALLEDYERHTADIRAVYGKVLGI